MHAMQQYIAGGTAGLMAYLKAYNVSADDLAARLSSHPRFYAEVAATDIRGILAYEKEIVRAARNLQRLAPQTPEVPMYFFVGALGHGATVKEVTPEGGANGLGILVPIELLATSRNTDMSEFPEGRRGRGGLDGLPQLTTHELAHVAQVQLQSLERYRRIYREKFVGIIWPTQSAKAVRTSSTWRLEGCVSGTAILQVEKLSCGESSRRCSTNPQPLLEAGSLDGARKIRIALHNSGTQSVGRSASNSMSSLLTSAAR